MLNSIFIFNFYNKKSNNTANDHHYPSLSNSNSNDKAIIDKQLNSISTTTNNYVGSGDMDISSPIADVKTNISVANKSIGSKVCNHHYIILFSNPTLFKLFS